MKISEEVKCLEHNYDLAIETIKELAEKNELLKEKLREAENLCKSMIPNQVYTHKKRKNTTVKFLDGSQQTVKRKAGEKDCIETAIAYCVLKQLITAKDLKKLIENKEEH